MRNTSSDAEQNRPASPLRKRSARQFAVVAGVVIVAFLVGFVPMWWTARAHERERGSVERQLRAAERENALAAAAILARRGEYERAREAASRFYTSLDADVDTLVAAGGDPQRVAALQVLLQGRDDVITLLARSDPAAADRLSDLYMAYRTAA